MKKQIKDLDLDVYSKTLENGLQIFVVPVSNLKSIYVTYNTKYGGIHNDFMYENKMINVSKGIAHFLEHKMFEEEDDSKVFDFFSKSGARANAHTSNYKTTYEFSGSNNYYDNLEYLLNYVENPYFTNDNVEKEKGIIIEELEMHKDNPYNRIIETVLYNAFINHPIKYPVIGTVESIKSITKEDLYKCYNTFYNPSNMYIVISGNVEVDKTFDIIEKHESKRNIIKNNIVLKEYNEVDKVEKEYEEIEMDIKYPKVAVAYKININDYKGDKYLLNKHILNAVDLKFGSTSLLAENLRNKKIINDTIDYTSIYTSSHILLVIVTETTHIEEAIKAIENEMKSLSINKDDFKRRIKGSIASSYAVLDSVYNINGLISNQILNKNMIDYTPIDTIRRFNLEEINNDLSKLNLNNETICVVRNK